MPANFGVNFTVTNGAASPIRVQSQTSIGIAAAILGVSKEQFYSYLRFENKNESPILAFNNVEKARDFVKNFWYSQDNRLLDTLESINLQNVSCPIIISFFEESTQEQPPHNEYSNEASNEDLEGQEIYVEPALEQREDSTLARCCEAIERFKKARHETGFSPDIIIAPYYSGEAGVRAKLESVASAMRITAVVDLEARNVGEALNLRHYFSSKRLIAAFPKVQILNSRGQYAFVPQSPFIAAMIAHTDGEREYGFSDSYSNRVMNGVTGVEHFIDFVMGEDCDADRLRTAHISTVILYEGYRTWGGDTSDTDEIWQDLARVRTFDRIAIAAQKASFKAIDKRASQLYLVKLSVEEMLRDLKGAKVLIGYEVSWNEERNTAANVSAGKFYLDVRMMNNPIVKLLTIDFIYSDEWSKDLIKSLSAE